MDYLNHEEDNSSTNSTEGTYLDKKVQLGRWGGQAAEKQLKQITQFFYIVFMSLNHFLFPFKANVLT